MDENNFGSRIPDIIKKNYFQFEGLTILVDDVVIIQKENRFAGGKINDWVYSIVLNKDLESNIIRIKNLRIDFKSEEERDNKFTIINEKLSEQDVNIFTKLY